MMWSERQRAALVMALEVIGMALLVCAAAFIALPVGLAAGGAALLIVAQGLERSK